MAVTEDDWVAIWKAAGIAGKIAGSGNPHNPGLRGRFIASMAKRIVEFWGRHRDTLAPALAQIAVAALDALVMALPEILLANYKGPG